MTTPQASKYFAWGTQPRRVYDLLCCGPATGSQIVKQTGILKYQQAIGMIRKRLARTGVTVKARPINHRRNQWEYRLGMVNVDPQG